MSLKWLMQSQGRGQCQGNGHSLETLEHRSSFPLSTHPLGGSRHLLSCVRVSGNRKERQVGSAAAVFSLQCVDN